MSAYLQTDHLSVNLLQKQLICKTFACIMADSGLSEQDDEDVSRTSELVAPEIVLETTPSTPEAQSPRASPQPWQNAASASPPGYRPEYVPSGHQWNMGNQPPMLAMT